MNAETRACTDPLVSAAYASRWKSAVLACLLLCASSGWSQNLTDVYQQARDQDKQFASARKALEAAMEKLPQARAGLLPTLSLSGTDYRQWGEASFAYEPYVHRDLKAWSWTAQLTQPLLRWGNWLAWQQADAYLEQAKQQFLVAELDLMTRTAQGYFDVLAAQESARVADMQLQAVAAQLVLAQRNFEVGTGTITDVHEARAKRAMSTAQQVSARNELINKQAELARITGQAAPGPAELGPRALRRSLPELDQDSLAQWLTLAEQGSPQIKAQQAAWEAARKEVDKNQAQHLPTLDLVANRATNFSSGSLSSPADIATRVHSQQVGVQLTVPLFAGGAVQSKVRESLALQDKAQEELAGTQRAVASQIRQSHAGVINAQVQIEALQEAVQAADKALESNSIGFRIGTRINPDVLNAQQQLYAAMRDLNRARIDAILQAIRLKAAAGVLQIEDLQLIDTLLDPAEPIAR